MRHHPMSESFSPKLSFLYEMIKKTHDEMEKKINWVF